MAEDVDIELERIYTIPLRKIKELPITKRAPRALREIRKFVSKHMKVDEDSIWIDPPVNEKIWERGRGHIPSRIRVKTLRFAGEETAYVEVTLAGE